MASPVTLSITDPECILHKYQQLVAFGKHKGTVELVATLQGDVCPSKAKIQIVFKKFDLLPDEVKRDLQGRLQVNFDGKSPGDPAYHLIPRPLCTRIGLSYTDKNLSLSRSSEHEYHFPLVKGLEYDIKNLSEEGLSEEERAFIDTIKEIVKERFPNASETTESVTYYVPESVSETRGSSLERSEEMGDVADLFDTYTDEQPRWTYCQATVIVVALIAIAQSVLMKFYSQS
ncbi:MAG: hypothetical protein KR126chlam3_01112 [Chlamydiae bacterium]|nr:hypothetical protein [Chlamydiota bacterium]